MRSESSYIYSVIFFMSTFFQLVLKQVTQLSLQIFTFTKPSSLSRLSIQPVPLLPSYLCSNLTSLVKNLLIKMTPISSRQLCSRVSPNPVLFSLVIPFFVFLNHLMYIYLLIFFLLLPVKHEKCTSLVFEKI